MPASLEQQWKLEEDILLKKLITQGMSYKDMDKYILGRTRRAIDSRAFILGLKSGTPKIKHSKDENFWEIPNKLNCYYAGLLAADGCIHDQSNSTSWSCEVKDKIYLEYFSNYIKFSGTIKYGTKINDFTQLDNRKNTKSISNMAHLRICNCKKWHRDMAKNFSLTPRKSHRLAPPNLNNDLLKCCYIIGYIDGDGCLHVNNRGEAHISFTSASINVLEWIKDFIEHNFPFKLRNKPKNISTSSEGTYHHYSIYGMQAIKVFEFLRQIDVPKYDRKWQNPKFLEMCQKYREKYPYFFDKNQNLTFNSDNNLQATI